MDTILQLLLGPAGTLVLAIVILVTGWKRMWVFGWHYEEVSKEKNEWKQAALQGTTIAEHVVTIHEASTKERRHAAQ